MIGKDVLLIPMSENDAEAEDIKDYLKQLLCKLWADGEQFSGKSPFGNSGWEYELYAALIKAKAINGVLDENGYVQQLNDRETKRANSLIYDAINAL